ITALIAFGISLVYRANGIINFAQADLGVLPAVVMVTLVGGERLPGQLAASSRGRGWAYWAALPVALIIAVLLGLVVERVVIRPFSKAPRLILMVATIGLAQLLAGVGTAIPFWLGTRTLSQRIRSPFSLDFTVRQFVFHGGDVLAIIAVPLTIAGLIAFLRFTSYGVSIRASAESAD